MRNYWSPIPPVPPPFPPPGPPGHYGEPIRGEIINGRLFPLGCVSEEDYAADKAAIERRVSEVEEKLKNNQPDTDVDISEIKADIALLKTETSDTNQALAILQRETAEIKSDTVSLQAEAADASRTLAILQEKTAEIEADVEAVKDIIDSKPGTDNIAVLFQEEEPEINNCFWFRPISHKVEPFIATFVLNEDTSKSNILAEINGKDYAVENVVDTPEELTAGKYNFEIFKTKE